MQDLDRRVAALADEWDLVVGPPIDGGTSSQVFEAVRGDGTPAVLKLAADLVGEERFLRAADGQGCVRLLRGDADRGALLLERLGDPLVDQDLPVDQQHDIICRTLEQVWTRPPDPLLPDGVQYAGDLAGTIRTLSTRHPQACAPDVIDAALRLTDELAAGYAAARAVLVHGDAHQWNTLRDPLDPAAYRLVDPDGFRAEREADLAVLLRESTEPLLAGDPVSLGADRAARLADRTGTDAALIRRWAVVLNTVNGLLWHAEGVARLAAPNLALATAWARSGRAFVQD